VKSSVSAAEDADPGRAGQNWLTDDSTVVVTAAAALIRNELDSA